MRWIRVAALVAVCCATPCLAETPDFSGSRPQAMQIFQGRLSGGQGWWSRYGEPVNSVALTQAESIPADKHLIGPMSEHGDGYVYGPGACDCPPPCIWHLWAGYFQNPKRCHPHVMKHVACANCSGDPVACGCAPVRGMLAKIFHHGGCDSCGCSEAVGCGDKVGCGAAVSCTTPAADCGCKPTCCKCRPCHLSKFRCFAAHWNGGCDSCSCAAPTGCGCTTPAPAAEGAPTQAQPTQAFQGPPKPLPEEALLHPLPRLN